MDIKKEIEILIKSAVKKTGMNEVDFSVEYPTEISNGDFATNVALIAGKQRKTNPRELAESIKSEIEKQKPDFLEKIEVAGPGFINFFLSKEFFAESLKKILKDDDDWGRNKIFSKKNILVEHSSPNLFKTFHIGHVMNNAIGESIVRLAHFSGAKVTAISYPSDVSLGIGKAVWFLLEDGGLEKLRSMTSYDQAVYLGECYAKGVKAYDERPEIQARVREITSNIYEKKKSPEYKLYEEAKLMNISSFKAITTLLGSKFDDFIYESQAGKEGKKIVENHVGDIFSKSDGAVIYEGEKDGLHTRVFINADGYPTYEAKDIGLLSLKFSMYKPDLSIFITDHEQESYFKVVMSAAKKINKKWAEKSAHRTHGRMSFRGEKMSSRLGGAPSAQSLLDFLYEELKKRASDIDYRKIAVAALKFPILRAMAGRNIDFDPDTSLSFEGGTGPYLQYSAVRALSVIAKAKKIKANVKLPEIWQTTLLEKHLIRFPDIVRRSIEEWEPHHVAGYLLELSQLFNSWYGNTKIADEKDPSSPYKISLAKAFRITMQNGLYLLGIEIPEKM